MAVKSLHQILAERKLLYFALSVQATVLPYTVYVKFDEQSRSGTDGARRAAIKLFIKHLGKPPTRVLSAWEILNQLPNNARKVTGGWLGHGHAQALKPVNWNAIYARCGGVPRAFDPNDDLDIASWLKYRQLVFPSRPPESPAKT